MSICSIFRKGIQNKRGKLGGHSIVMGQMDGGKVGPRLQLLDKFVKQGIVYGTQAWVAHRNCAQPHRLMEFLEDASEGVVGLGL